MMRTLFPWLSGSIQSHPHLDHQRRRLSLRGLQRPLMPERVPATCPVSSEAVVPIANVTDDDNNLSAQS